MPHADRLIAPDFARAPQPPRRLWLRSLTARLVVGVVALVLVLVTAVGAATYFALSSFLVDRLDQQLSPIADYNAQRLAACLADTRAECKLGTGAGSYRAVLTEWVVVLDSDGAPKVRVDPPTESLQPLSLSRDERAAIAADPPRAATLSTTDGTELRVEARPIQVPSGRYVVLTGLSTDEVTKTLGRLLSIELIIGGGAVLVAFLATSWGVRRSLRNLYRVTGTAREVAAELSPEGAGLDRRVPVTEAGTEVGQLAESMNTLLSAVEMQFAARLESEHRMRQFLADASHELRTPLTSIRGYAELARMQRAATGQADPGSADNLDRIESEGTRMSRLVDDLLTLARGDADSRNAETEIIDVAGLLDEAVAGSRAAFGERPIELEMRAAPAVYGDRDQLLRAVRNLITNAAVHTAAGRPIMVRGFGDGPQTVITIADGGPGLPPDDAARVFERFWRADKARSRARGGTGLGMAIVATIVRAHGGSVRFDSNVETGSTATLRLPAAQARPEAAQS